MISSIRTMWLSAIISACMVALSYAAGEEYLPPNKGYNYDAPAIPFPPVSNPVKQPTPPPYRPPQRPAPPPQRPSYIPPQPQEHHEEHHEHHDDHHHEPGMPFDFSYAVNEDDNNFSHNAISDGDVTRGEYRIALPDGRTQIVKYTADWKSGFNAEVTYEGEAQYPEPPVGGYGRGPAPQPSQPSGGQQYVPPSQGGGYQY